MNIAWAMTVVGATLIITCSTLFLGFRDWLKAVPKLHELVVCPMCTGFWVGAVASLLGLSLNSPEHPLALRVFGDACAAAWVCWANHVVLCALGQGRLLSSRPDLPKPDPFAFWRQEGKS